MACDKDDEDGHCLQLNGSSPVRSPYPLITVEMLNSRLHGAHATYLGTKWRLSDSPLPSFTVHRVSEPYRTTCTPVPPKACYVLCTGKGNI